MKITNHRLDGVDFVPASTKRVEIVPTLLVIHYTATHDARGPIAFFKAPTAAASAHLVVDTDGTIVQMVDFNRRAAHAGASSWKGQQNCNGFSIGIEVVNPGPLVEREDGTLVDTIAKKPWAHGAVETRHKNGGSFEHWAVYPDAQMRVLVEAAKAICATYGITEIAGHDDIAPTRKIDPGPAFPMKNFVNEVLGGVS